MGTVHVQKSLVRVNTNRDGIGLAGVHRHHAQTAVVAVQPIHAGARQCRGEASRSNANLTFKQAPANLAGLSYHEAVAKSIPSVVRIYTTNSATAGIEKADGSGVIIDKQGYRHQPARDFRCDADSSGAG